MAKRYQSGKERRSPFHPEHYHFRHGYGLEVPHARLIGNPCAPEFFAKMEPANAT